MKKNLLLLLVFSMVSFQFVHAQTVEELTAQKEAKAAELAKLEAELAEVQGKVDGLKGEVSALTEQLTPYPRIKTGLSGTIGLNFATFNDWLPKDQSNTSAITIGTSMGGFVNSDWEKYFWRNNANLTLGWLKFDDKDNPDDIDDFQVSADAFNVMSLFGWKLNSQWAVSALGEYRTSILDDRFNNPGYFDIGAGATWTPLENLVAVFHPLNYNFAFGDEVGGFSYESSLGCKAVVDYNTKIAKSIIWKSNFSGFLSYSDSDLSNWTWVNGLSTAIKGVGIGFDLGLRGNKQESLAGIADGKLEEGDNPLQLYWLLGFSYAIATK
ncbi:MAG: DUF3078 domain-containing protein [Bacteroidota bacterium]